MKEIFRRLERQDMVCLYLRDTKTGRMGFTLVPKALEGEVSLREDKKLESMVQVKLTSDRIAGNFSNGHSMRNSESSMGLRFSEQYQREDGSVVTVLKNDRLEARHILAFREGEEAVRISTILKNCSAASVCVEMLSSFSLAPLFPFCDRQGTGDYELYRLRSRWSEEGRLEKTNLLDLQMEPSWQKSGMQNLRFGQVGTMPVRGFFPWIALEDTRNQCLMGAMLGWSGSWQLEVFSEDGLPAISGGLADREMGHWKKVLAPGEEIETPWALLTVCQGDLDLLCNRLTRSQKGQGMSNEEAGLPIIFNEFCTSWGRPSQDSLCRMVDLLQGRGIRYCVIDAGWYADEDLNWESNMGDWIVNKDLFPQGMKGTAKYIRDHGMIPGIWFEMENAGEKAKVYRREELLLHRDGFPITTERRRFLDLRKEEVRAYLGERVLAFLQENGFGYVKIDYNDNIGLGCDGAESLGEGLRQQVLASYDLFRELRQICPGLVIENCASGGHRLDPMMLSLTDLSSISDAHECTSIPKIAANVLRAVPAAQSQIWAVLRKDDDEKRLYYTMANTFLGRMCLSGDAERLAGWQWEIVDKGIQTYRSCADLIEAGEIHWYGETGKSYARLTGWQVVSFERAGRMLVVAHRFHTGGEEICLPLTDKKWALTALYGREQVRAEIGRGAMRIDGLENLEAAVLVLKEEGVSL